MEMYLAGVSTRRTEDVSEILLGIGHLGVHGVRSQRGGLAVSKECWRDFFPWLRGCGLHGARMSAGGKSAAMIWSIAEVLPDAVLRAGALLPQRPDQGPKSKRSAVAAILKAVHAMESRETLTCTKSPARTGEESAPTTRSRGSAERSGKAPGLWRPPPMGGACSC